MRLVPLELCFCHDVLPSFFKYLRARRAGAAWPIIKILRLRQLRFDFFCNVRRNFLVMREFHAVLRAPLSERTQLVYITKHVGKWHHCLDRLRVSARVGALDLSTT